MKLKATSHSIMLINQKKIKLNRLKLENIPNEIQFMKNCEKMQYLIISIHTKICSHLIKRKQQFNNPHNFRLAY